MEDMTKYPWLALRGRTYYLRVPVPADIRSTFGPREIWKTLGTQDRKEALRRYYAAAAEIQSGFGRHREKIARDAEPPLETLTDEQVRIIGDAVFRRNLLDDEKERLLGFNDEEFEQYVSDIALTDGIAREFNARGGIPGFVKPLFKETVERLELQWRLSEASTSWPKIARAMVAAGVKANEDIRKRNAGDVIDTPPMPLPLSRRTTDAPKPTLKDARDFYVKERVTGDEFTRNKNIQRVDRMVRSIEEALKDIPALPDWTAQDAYRVRDYLLNDRKMKPATVRRELNTAKGIFSLYKKRLRRDLDNPFGGLELPASAVTDKESRDPLSAEHVAAIRKLVLANNNAELGLIWRLLETTGCRLAEITGLRRQDVLLEVGTPHLRIVSHPRRTLKTSSSVRDIPLIGDGLAAAKEALELSNEGEAVFPRYSNGGRGANGASALLMRRVRQVTDDPKLSVHSLRHSFADRCDLAGVSPMDKSALLGHLANNASERHYGSRQAKLAVLARALRKALGLTDNND